MDRLLALILLSGISAKAQIITESFGTGVNQFSIDFVQIGNPGNAADTTGSPSPAGSVSYTYNIGKYEISREMVLKASSAGGLGLTLADLTFYGGNGMKRPASGVSWNEAARFVNYLNSSTGHQVAYNFVTSGGNDYISLWATGLYSGNNQFRHKDSYYFLPSLDEWYKAAYGSPNGTWYNFSNGSDSPPQPVSGGLSGAVYGGQSGPADINDAGALSAYGTMGQGGNVWEWTETAFDGVNDSESETRELRGGAWNNNNTQLDANFKERNFGDPSREVFGSDGFRVASVPEPSALSLLAVGLGGLALVRRRRS